MNLDKQIEEVIGDMLDLMEEGGMDCSYSGNNYEEAKIKAVAALKRLIKEVASEVIGKDFPSGKIDLGGGNINLTAVAEKTANQLRCQQRAKLKELLKGGLND